MRAITDAAASVVQTYQTDAFGVLTPTQGSSTQPFQYTGEPRDAESGFVYLRARVYDPAIGRFLQRDPFAGAIGYSLSLNRYAYALPNPVRFIDRSGLDPTNQASSDCKDSTDLRTNCYFPRYLLGPLGSLLSAWGPLKDLGPIGGDDTARETRRLTGEEFVHVTPRRFVQSIAEKGLDPAVSGGRVYITKLKYVAGKTPEELERMLYSKDLQAGKVGYFSEGGIAIVVLPSDVRVTYRGVTTRPDGVPQWTYEGTPLKDITILEVP